MLLFRLNFSFVLDPNLVQGHVLQPELKLGGALKAVQVIFEEHACSKCISRINSLSFLLVLWRMLSSRSKKVSIQGAL